MVTIATVNVNGIKSATGRGKTRYQTTFLTWLQNISLDVVCLQEINASEQEFLSIIQPIMNQGWQLQYVVSSTGKVGVAILSRQLATVVNKDLDGITQDFRGTGRYLEVVIGDTTISSIYVFEGNSSYIQSKNKHNFLDALIKRTGSIDKKFILAGDMNIAYTPLDTILGNKCSCYCACQWFEQYLDTGKIDAMRYLYPHAHDQFSWWSPRGTNFEDNRGWRIDYQLVTSDIAQCITTYNVDRQPTDSRWSDHAPIIVDYAYEL